jgi:hypothetical protein
MWRFTSVAWLSCLFRLDGTGLAESMIRLANAPPHVKGHRDLLCDNKCKLLGSLDSYA